MRGRRMEMAERKILEVVPAYGRKYTTTAIAEREFHDGKDFMMVNGGYNGSYMSIRDAARIKNDGYAEIHIYTDTRREIRTVHVL
jgi:hypothetical protein